MNVSPRYYDVWARSATELKPSLYLSDQSRHNAVAEAKAMWGSSEDLRSVWVQTGDVIVWAAGEKADELAEVS